MMPRGEVSDLREPVLLASGGNKGGWACAWAVRMGWCAGGVGRYRRGRHRGPKGRLLGATRVGGVGEHMSMGCCKQGVSA